MNRLKNFLTKLFSLEIQKFSKIIINESVMENIMDFAKANHPKEFVALLRGKVKENKLTITSLVYQPFTGTNKSSWVRINVPSMSDVMGTVHSHPSKNPSPSTADIHFFTKNGVVHLIICYPYRINDIKCYDLTGNRQTYSIDLKN